MRRMGCGLMQRRGIAVIASVVAAAMWVSVSAQPQDPPPPPSPAAAQGSVQPPPGAAPPAAMDGFAPMGEGAPREVLPATPLVFYAYGFVWIALVGYVFLMWRRMARVEQELADVQRRLRGDQQRR